MKDNKKEEICHLVSNKENIPNVPEILPIEISPVKLVDSNNPDNIQYFTRDYFHAEIKEMTNRDWLESLPTREFADFISQSPCEAFCIFDREECSGKRCIDGIIYWLKQKYSLRQGD